MMEIIIRLYFAKKAKIKYIDANKTKNLLNLSSFLINSNYLLKL